MPPHVIICNVEDSYIICLATWSITAYSCFSGVLLPGKEIQFPFYFKSPNPGIFSEMWVLATSPVMNKGRPVVVTLKGVAFQEDLYRKRREEIEVC